MASPFKARIALTTALSLAAAPLALTSPAAAAQTPAAAPASTMSPALCGKGDAKEPGIQGDVPAGQTAAWNCGVRRIASLPRVGSVQGVGTCAYVRSGGDKQGSTVYVIDVRNPAKPVEVGSFPVKYASETMRLVTNAERSVLVSGSSVYDVSNCLKPVLMGEIKWPPLAMGTMPPLGGGGGTGILPHDLRINPAGTRVYASQGLWEVDISDLRNPDKWAVIDRRCEVATQVAGPWQAIHRDAERLNMSLCADAKNPRGADYRMGSSGVQTSLLWPMISHGIGVSGDNKRVYIGEQAGGAGKAISGGRPKLRVFDVSQNPIKFLGDTDGAGHSVDWFRTGAGEYVVHANEGGTTGLGGVVGVPNANLAALNRMAGMGDSDTCKPHPRYHVLGWAFDALVSDVTDPTKPRNVSRLSIAINEPENCEARKASGKDPSVAYHMIDDANNGHFAAVNFGTAGLRIFDIRKPESPSEVAYFNHGPMVHGGVGYYDAKRGLIYAAGNDGLWILELEPQVRKRLGI